MVSVSAEELKGIWDRAVALYDQGMYSEAIAEFTQVMGLTDEESPDHKRAASYVGDSYAKVGLAHLRMNMFPKAEEELRQAVTIHPGYPDLRYYLALSLYRQGRYADAEEHLNKALELNPKFARALFHLGLARVRQGDMTGIKSITNAASIEPAFRRIKYNQALRLFQENSVEESMTLMEQVVEMDTDQVRGLIEKGHKLMKLRMYRDAASTFLEAVTMCPHYADLRQNLGLCYIRQGMFDLAIGQFTKALDINSKYASARISLALAYEKTGRRVLAIAELETVLREDPKNETAARFMHMLQHRTATEAA